MLSFNEEEYVHLTSVLSIIHNHVRSLGSQAVSGLLMIPNKVPYNKC